MSSRTDTYLELLNELGIEVDAAAWAETQKEFAAGPREAPPPTLLPVKPDHYAAGGLPVFTSSQVAWCDPEVYGWDDYEVVEDEATAHPYVLSWTDEQYYWGNRRNVHRYSRLYRVRWTLGHVVGHLGKLPPGTEAHLRDRLREEPGAVHGRGAYEWVRRRLKETGESALYLSIPYAVRQLGGPRWKVTDAQYNAVLEDAYALCKTFDALRKAGRVGRRRFPKIQYVLLRLLDRHGVAPPYKVLWARTSIKRRQLRGLLARLDAGANDEPRLQKTMVSPRPPEQDVSSARTRPAVPRGGGRRGRSASLSPPGAPAGGDVPVVPDRPGKRRHSAASPGLAAESPTPRPKRPRVEPAADPSDLDAWCRTHRALQTQEREGRRLAADLFHVSERIHAGPSDLNLFRRYDPERGKDVYFWASCLYALCSKVDWRQQHLPGCTGWDKGGLCFTDRLLRRCGCPTDLFDRTYVWMTKPSGRTVHEAGGRVLRHGERETGGV